MRLQMHYKKSLISFAISYILLLLIINLCAGYYYSSSISFYYPAHIFIIIMGFSYLLILF